MFPNDELIGRNIQGWRAAKNLTQEELAGAMALDRSAISRIESGNRPLTALELVRAADFIGIDPRRLLGLDERPVTMDSSRVVIESVTPEVDGGEFPAKRILGDYVKVEAHIFADGHDALSGVLMHRKDSAEAWTETPLEFLGNDHWSANFQVPELGKYVYTLEAWADPFKSWRRDLDARIAAGQDVTIDLQIGAEIVRSAVGRARGGQRSSLERGADVLAGDGKDAALKLCKDEGFSQLVGTHADRREATRYSRELEIVVEPVRALYGAWYEMFPRSAASSPGQHGTWKDCEARLPYIAEMGFDVLYLPPIHPVGTTHRKGRNNSTTAKIGEPGSPWAIGSAAGGHKDVNPELGTLEDFRKFVEKAAELSIDIALDLAYQCSPDHPYVREHPSWFRTRPDGSVQYAENPPKKYEDIYPLNFQSEDWEALWQELRDVVLFWIDQGVHIFRVDNPHTKPLRFWAWLIDQVKQQHPEVIFLAEAFTRPAVMYSLAKLGFSQSYTYFAWRNNSWELREYFTELTTTEVKEFFRPNLWPNTPDILTEYLQFGGRAALATRLILAATLGASYGIYGPPFELGEVTAREAGSEEYLDSEKYQIRHWELNSPESLKDLITRVNRIRRASPALQRNDSLTFHNTDNEYLLCYSKQTEEEVILTVVNLDPHHRHSGWVELKLELLGLSTDQPFQAHDLLSDARYIWTGARNYVELDPNMISGHVFRLHARVRRENDFDYFI